jgi:prephenate dehydratase
VSFLESFSTAGINLSRIISRPVQGRPEQYAFLLDVEDTLSSGRVEAAILRAEAAAESLKVLGTYPVIPRYES